MYFGEVDRVQEYMDRHASKAGKGMGTAEHIIGTASIQVAEILPAAMTLTWFARLHLRCSYKQ